MQQLPFGEVNMSLQVLTKKMNSTDDIVSFLALFTGRKLKE